MSGYFNLGYHGDGCRFILCQALLKMGILHHKIAMICKQKSMAVCAWRLKESEPFKAILQAYEKWDHSFFKQKNKKTTNVYIFSKLQLVQFYTQSAQDNFNPLNFLHKNHTYFHHSTSTFIQRQTLIKFD